MANTKANSVSKFSVKPATRKAAKVPTSEMMMEMDGMRVARKSCKKKYTTNTTSKRAIISVSSTLAIDSSKKSLDDIICVKCNPLGRSFSSSFNLAVNRSLVSLALAPANWKAINCTAGLPFTRPEKV